MGDFSLSSVIDLSLSLFPHTPVMRQTWRIVTAGNSSRIHKQTEKQPEMTSRTLRRSIQLSVGCAKKSWICDRNIDCVITIWETLLNISRDSTTWEVTWLEDSPSVQQACCFIWCSLGWCLQWGNLKDLLWHQTESPVVLSTSSSIFHFPPHVFFMKARHPRTYGDFWKLRSN